MKQLILLFTLLMACHAVADGVYKWVDDKGKVHYGSQEPVNQQAEQTTISIKTYTNVTLEKSASESNSKKVLMYATSWCGYCKKARKYFAANSIPYKEYDIEKNAAAKRKYDKLGATGVPVILVGDKRMNGFNEKGFKKIYD